MATQKRIEDLGDGPDSGGKSEARKSSSASKRPSTSRKAENELSERLAECFARIANALENRGDDELSEIIREDALIMSAGLVSLTRPFKMLRMPLLAFVAIIEPMLAFGRIVRVLAGRFADRREIAKLDAQNRAEESAYATAPTE